MASTHPHPLPTFVVVAIDGGAATGKSTTARTVADRLHLLHVDTGAHYRAVTLALLRAEVSAFDGTAVAAFIGETPLATEVSGHRALVRIGGYLPHETELRSAEVNAAVSHYAALPSIRQWLLPYQQGLAGVARQHHFRGLVMEGRDIGTVIFPQADYKFFLVADPVVRAQRRAQEGQDDSIAQRDRLDSGRVAAPLACAPDAIVVDTVMLNAAEAAGFVIGVVHGGLRPALRSTTLSPHHS